jgi:hypothetical protein
MIRNPKTPYVQRLLISFGLKQASARLPDLINEAEKQNLTPRQFLLTVLEEELNARNEKNGNAITLVPIFLRMSAQLMSLIHRNWMGVSPPPRSSS